MCAVLRVSSALLIACALNACSRPDGKPSSSTSTRSPENASEDKQVNRAEQIAPEAQLRAARAELAELRKRYTDLHPIVIEKLRTIADLEQRIEYSKK